MAHDHGKKPRTGVEPTTGVYVHRMHRASASLGWEGWVRLMLTGCSCSWKLLNTTAPRGSLGGQSTEVPWPYFPWVWDFRLLVSWLSAVGMVGVHLRLTGTFFFLNPPASGGCCSSSGLVLGSSENRPPKASCLSCCWVFLGLVFVSNPSMARCHQGSALSMARCLARSRPWADPGGIHEPSVSP